MPKKFSKISKFFRVALEGATTDGRAIDRNWIIQMAKNFNPAKYGARIWMEHIRGMLPDAPFKAYGDVVALKSEEVEIDGVRKMALFAQIEPTPELVAMNKARQKIYTSIEVNPNFADTGEAYLVGLGITDSPASLGTEVLSFASQNPESSPFKYRKSFPESLISEAVEVELEFEEVQQEEHVPGIFASVKEMLDKLRGKEVADDARFSEVKEQFSGIHEAVSGLLDHAEKSHAEVKLAFKHIDTLEKQLEKQQAAFSLLKQQLESTPGNTPSRPESTGGTGEVQTDC